MDVSTLVAKKHFQSAMVIKATFIALSCLSSVSKFELGLFTAGAIAQGDALDIYGGPEIRKGSAEEDFMKQTIGT